MSEEKPDAVTSSTDAEENESDAPNEDWSHITKPGPHDVLCGRGGGTNNHSGNVKFRQVVNEYKLKYLAASKVDKPKVAREVVKLWRGLDPSGRFLARKDDGRRGPGSVKAEGNVWYDVGDKKAREKASQCLRERTPDVLPYVREMQRQQDILTGQGLKLVEQQMRMRNEQRKANNAQAAFGVQYSNPAAAMGGMNPAELQNAFSQEYFFTHGFQNAQQQQQMLAQQQAMQQAAFAGAAPPTGMPPTGMPPTGMPPTDPMSMQQMSQWNAFPPQQQAMPQAQFSSADLEPMAYHPAQAQMAAAMAARQQAQQQQKLRGGAGKSGGRGGGDSKKKAEPKPDHVASDELTLEEYMESMKEYKAYHLEGDEAGRTKELLQMQDNSWVKSFHSLESKGDDGLESSNSSLEGAAAHKKKKKGNSLDRVRRQTESLGKMGQSTRTHLSNKSAMSAISTKSGLSAKSGRSSKSAMSGVSLFSEDSRASKMSKARDLGSNLSMMSDFTELTDLSDALNNVDLQAGS
eukprot:CAMPEP_0202474792 /NCGR_PEP_ID=MMETSP1360-20130828/92568_1 /ASSEMBLY_ACC=CAM_ASM_000848 /TAXON_ID=515479 /ORGANISM="Licmophora paradoxa, Strain CCMP2313" /LENGTH=517 /DNA_ID=CAMNT_0049101933 /DNA_START=34 /DNA_END=1587 /DNA_ORIENTATION=-